MKMVIVLRSGPEFWLSDKLKFLPAVAEKSKDLHHIGMGKSGIREIKNSDCGGERAEFGTRLQKHSENLKM